MKKVVLVIGVVVVLIVAAVFLLLGSLDDIVADQIEVVGTELTGVPVSVGGVSIDLATGTGQITSMTIGNVDGFPSDYAFKIDLLRLGIDITSITKQPIVLSELIIESPVVNIDFDESGGSNLKQITDNVSKTGGQADSVTSEEQAASDPIKIAIRKLEITGVTFNSSNPVTGNDTGTLPSIRKTNMGGSAGATPEEIGKEIIGDLAGQIIAQAAKDKVSDIIKEKTSGLEDKIKGAFDGWKKD